MASQPQEDVENWPSEPPGALGGVGEPLSLSPRNWLAAQPCRCPLADPGKPTFWSITGYSCRADPKHQTLGIAFSPWCSECLWERLLSLSVQSKFVRRRVQYLLFGVGEKMENYLWFLSDICEGFSEGHEFPKPESPFFLKKGHSLGHLVHLATFPAIDPL